MRPLVKPARRLSAIYPASEARAAPEARAVPERHLLALSPSLMPLVLNESCHPLGDTELGLSVQPSRIAHRNDTVETVHFLMRFTPLRPKARRRRR